ncbi:MAG: peptide chain release factor 2 [Deltaproteobacteria bacterium]|nr:MAG: peptide chain release factor 2 [Deltaproteobacteria bacterium]
MGNWEISGSIFDLTKGEDRLKKIERILSKTDFWQNNHSQAAELSQERGFLSNNLEEWHRYKNELEELSILTKLAQEENDETSILDARKELSELEKAIRSYELQTLLGDKDDKRNAIVAINAGAGGTEAQDWVEMLLRLYLKWAESRKMKTRIVDHLAGDEAGIKNVTFTVSGPYAYGYLKSEHGIHRMVRISPFDANGRRHTSFASVSILPEIADDIKIDISEKDLRLETFRASGPGGQHVNKTSSAVRITHVPTNIVVQCQNEKSQHRNKDLALKILKARLYALEKEKQDREKQLRHQSQKEIAWGNQIRSYTFNPYQLVKDHRTNLEVGDIERVMNGDIDIFIDAYLKWLQN